MIVRQTDTEYNSGRGGDWISPSDIKGLRTPKDFVTNRLKPWVQKDYFDIGTAFHSAMLEPEKFDKGVIHFPDKDFPTQTRIKDGSIGIGGKGNKAVWEAFKALPENKDKIVLSEAYWNMVSSMMKSARDHKGFNRMMQLDKGWVETSFYCRYIWNKAGQLEKVEPAGKDDKRTSPLEMLVRTKADFVHKERAYAMDVKTAIDVSPTGFAKAVANLEYDIQATMVLDLVTANAGEPYETFIVLAVEKTEPYYAVMYDVFYEDLLSTKSIYLRRLNELRKSMNDNIFQGFEMYADNEFGLLSLKLPAWYKNQQINSKF